MSRLYTLFFVFILLIATGCSTLQVKSDYNPDFPFGKLHSVAVLYPKSDNDILSLAQQRFKRAIEETMKAKGYRVTDREHADFFMVFHLDITEKRQVVTDYQMIGLYPYRPFYGYGMAVPVEREYTWNEGRFILDAVTPRQNTIFWRGIAVDRLHDFDTPQERRAYIQRVVNEVLAKFPPKPSKGDRP
ncbi:MAG: DUF4136 domain-containing protein [Epsilonproteobacteria bacterium]|nr:DUF4136 domain-containing protein [Campylobacterota bacterium]